MSFLSSIKKALKVVAPIAGGVLGRTFGGDLGAGIGTGLGALASGADPKRALLGGVLGYGLSALTSNAAPELAGDVPVEDRSFQSDTNYAPSSAPTSSGSLADVDFIKAASDTAQAPQTSAISDIKNWFRDPDGTVNWAKTASAGLGALTLLDPGPAAVSTQPDPNQPLNQSAPTDMTFGADQLQNYSNPQNPGMQGPAAGYQFAPKRNPLAEAQAAYASYRG